MWWGQHVQTASWKEATKKLPACLKSTLDPHLRSKLQYESSESDVKILVIIVIMTSVSVKTSEVVKHYMHRFFHTAER